MSESKFIRRIIPASLVVFCESEEVAQGVVQGINHTLDCLQDNHCDVFMRMPPYMQWEPKEGTDPIDRIGMYRVRSRFAVASALEGREGRRIVTQSSFFEEEIGHPFDIQNNKGCA